MKRAVADRLFWAIVLLAAGVRVVAAFEAPPVHADQFFQYVEPAWQRLHGLAYGTWEWADGLRSWALPGYHGAWLAFFELVGVREGRTLGRLLALNWSLASLLLVFAARRAGAWMVRASPNELAVSGESAELVGGLVAAALVATFPLLVKFAPQTLSENGSMLALVWGLVFSAESIEERGVESRRRAGYAGLCLGLGVCLRIANGPLALVPFVWLVAKRRFRDAATLAGLALVPVVAFGLLDLATWGGFLSSFVAYLKFNFVEARATEFGVEPFAFYFVRAFERLPFALPLLVVPALAALRVTWPFVVSGLGMVVVLSSQPHKEERFVVLAWAYLLIAASAGWSRFMLASGRRTEARVIGALLALGLVVADGWARLRLRDFDQSQAVLDAQAWVGHRADATGLFVDDPYLTGGYLALGTSIPMTFFDQELLENPLYNYVITRRGSGQARLASAHGFRVIRTRRGRVVLFRKTPSGGG